MFGFLEQKQSKVYRENYILSHPLGNHLNKILFLRFKEVGESGLLELLKKKCKHVFTFSTAWILRVVYGPSFFSLRREDTNIEKLKISYILSQKWSLFSAFAMGLKTQNATLHYWIDRKSVV